MPTLSVVIASINGRQYLSECLKALHFQAGDIEAEVIVADCVGQSVADYVRTNYPEVHLITFGEPRSVAELRAAGILAARGSIVAITEDHCIPASDWYESVCRAHALYAGPAIGGAVDNAATERLVDWAVFFCEYSNFVSPLPAGIVHDLPGPNVSYKRNTLEAMEESIRDGYWETFLHARLEAQGHRLWSDPSVKVLHRKYFRFRDFMAERYHYARAFAGNRNSVISPGRRLFYLGFAALLPPLLIARIGRRVWSRKHHRVLFLAALPYLTAFMLAWSAGELAGYAFGPGESALQLS